VTTGELYDQIQKRKQIDLQDARFYAAEIVLMLQRLRQEKVIFAVSCTNMRYMQVADVACARVRNEVAVPFCPTA